ncbi:MAG: hypothetical protein QM710_07085 [Flavobacterium sp.]
MKRKKLMMTAVLAIMGVILLAFSVYMLYKNTSSSSSAKKQRELDEAIKKIEVLHAEIVQKDRIVEEAEQKIKSLKSDTFNQSAGQNLPIIEIVDNDLSEGNTSNEGGKKVHKLMYHHQIRFYLLNIGKNSLKDVIFSIKDDYNDNESKTKKKKIKGSDANVDYMGKKVNNDELGTYENFEVNTLNLKSKKQIYTSNLPGSFGTGDYEYHVIVEWSQGFYQMKIKITESNGKLSYNYEFFDVSGNPIDFKAMESRIAN